MACPYIQLSCYTAQAAMDSAGTESTAVFQQIFICKDGRWTRFGPRARVC